MHTDLWFSFSKSIRALAIGFFCCLFGVSAIHGQEVTTPKTVLDFEGNRIFSKQDLLAVANKCLAGYAKSDNDEILGYCLHRVSQFLSARGYLQAQLDKPRLEQTENGSRTIVSVKEGALFRIGEVEINGARVLTPNQIRDMFELKTGDVAEGDRIGVWLFERVKKAYGNLGYIQYTAEVQPRFHHQNGAAEGVADLSVTIDEGNAFTIASIQFVGNGSVAKDSLLREMTMRSGEVFSQQMLEESLMRIEQNGQFETIDADRDVDYWWDQKAPRLKLTIHLKKRLAEWTPPETNRRLGSIQVFPQP